MNLLRTIYLAPILLLTVGLTSCGSSAAPIPNLPANLNGNWNLGGNRSLRQYPVLSTALIVTGNQITAQGDMLVPCTNKPDSAVGSAFSLSGPIAADGTFQLTQSFNRAITVVLNGSVPKDATGWSGSITTTDSPGLGGCVSTQTNAFVATPLAPLNGTYTGTLAGTAFGTGVNVSLQISQGASATVIRSSAFDYEYVPLNATITVLGSTCFKQGTTASKDSISNGSSIAGDLINLNFIMDDTSTLMVTGWLADSSQTTIPHASFTDHGFGNCSNSTASTALSRQ
jgi:hypothetical protein